MKKIAYFFVMGILLCGCGNEQESSTSTDKETQANTNSTVDEDIVDNFDSENSAKILFDEEMHDFGNLSAGERVSYSFHFRNTGKKDLIISGCSASCGCTVPSYPKGRIAPGEEG